MPFLNTFPPWASLFLRLSRVFKGSLQAGTSTGLALSAWPNGKGFLVIPTGVQPSGSLLPPSSESSQRGDTLAFLKNHPICLPLRNPRNEGVQPPGVRAGGNREGKSLLALRSHHTPGLPKAFNGSFHYLKNEIKALKFATFEQRWFGITALSSSLPFCLSTFRW